MLHEVARAVGDPARREILERLHAAGPASANEIASWFAVSRPATSRHLRVLRDARLVEVEVIGRERRYALDPAPLAELERWTATLRTPSARPAAPGAEALGRHLDALETEVRRTRRDRRRAEHQHTPHSTPSPDEEPKTA